MHSRPVVALTNSTLYDELGEANVTGNIDDALDRARICLGLPTAERPAFPAPKPSGEVARETEHGERRKVPREERCS